MPVAAPPYPTGHDLLAGKTVLVTAAAGSGIGFAAAKRCLEEGARVMISDIHERRLGEAAERLAESGSEAPTTHPCDVRSDEAVRGLCAAAVEQMGQVTC